MQNAVISNCWPVRVFNDDLLLRKAAFAVETNRIIIRLGFDAFQIIQFHYTPDQLFSDSLTASIYRYGYSNDFRGSI